MQKFMEFPSGPVPLGSSFYINRPPIEELVYEEITKPGSVIRIKAPTKMGKSSLLLRIINYAQQRQYQTVLIDLTQADQSVFTNTDKFLRWFAANVSYQLELPAKLDEYWDEDIGSQISCTIYWQNYLLKKVEQPLVLAINEVNRLFEYSRVAQDFLSLLRGWHEEAKQKLILQKQRLVVVHSTEVYIPLNINQSPFNVGLPIKLPCFSKEQIQELAQICGLEWCDKEQEVEQLINMVGGHPYLVRLCLYHLVQPCLNQERIMSLPEILMQAPTQSGIYSEYLRHHLTTLEESPELAEAFQQIVNSEQPVQLKPVLAYKLESMGLVSLNGNYCQPACDLYRLYFRSQNLVNSPIFSDTLV